MKIYSLVHGIVLGGLLAGNLVNANPVNANPVQPEIEIITSDAYPITAFDALKQQGFNVKVYNLDDGKRLVKRLAGTLPPNQAAAKQQLENTLKQMGPHAVQQAFMQAFNAQQVAVNYGLDRYPAVVFNHGQAVVYGVTNLADALQHYHAWQEQQP